MQKEIRVLHLGLSDNIGGIETVVHSWLRYKPEWIHFDYIQIGNKPLAFEKDFIADGSSIIRIPSRASDYWKSQKALQSVLNEGKYDYLQHHIMSFSWPEPCILANNCKNQTKVILHSHSVMSDSFKVKYKVLHHLGRLRLSHHDYYKVACSAEAGKAMFSCNDYYVVRNGIDFNECAFNCEMRKLIRERFGYKDNDLVIGHVGRSCFEKNYPFIINTFSELIKKNDRYRLLLIGDILNDYEIQNMIKKSGVGEYIKCTGPIKKAKQIFSAMDIYYMPSIIEGVSVSLLEAQAAGLPCIVSSNVSQESKISDRIQFVDIRNVESVVERILKTVVFENGRYDVKLDDTFEIATTANQMFSFYSSNMGSNV